MARIREVVRGTQKIRPHKVEDEVSCQYQIIEDTDGRPLVHLSTFGSNQRESQPKSSQSLQLTLENASDLMDVFRDAFGISWGRRGKQSSPSDDAAPVFPDATDELAKKLYMSRDWLQQCIDLLRDRPQLIFYGPPGTGKTYLAKALAEHLSSAENVKVVQFHPSYSYEDFFEGFRPGRSSNGQVSYNLHQGPLRLIAEDARKNPGTLYPLIIDEINRGNLSKIFGELYYLLEYRGESINLLYSEKVEMFTLPKNVVIIGTMNTVDRSIASMDSAMRRRFSFVHLHPSEEPTNGILRRWLADKELPMEAADLLDELNRTIEGRDFKVGPSYFMRRSSATGRGFDLAWTTSILPLLEEIHFRDPSVDVHERYSLPRIRERYNRRITDPDA
ncbi:McrB family protein [Nocardia brasiliensis]|uniref:McrB family protein n=1 Tax=Nocardia brasiliensis TaxID=37326 RepID=UPI002454F36C|nr:AAA family ATPase [Nocardia brasiliensis]